MSEVEFIEENPMPIRSRPTSVGGIIGWLITSKIAANETEANQVLIATCVGVVLLALGIIWFSIPHSFGPKPPPPTTYKPAADLHGSTP